MEREFRIVLILAQIVEISSYVNVIPFVARKSDDLADWTTASQSPPWYGALVIMNSHFTPWLMDYDFAASSILHALKKFFPLSLKTHLDNPRRDVKRCRHSINLANVKSDTISKWTERVRKHTKTAIYASVEFCCTIVSAFNIDIISKVDSMCKCTWRIRACFRKLTYNLWLQLCPKSNT